MSRRRLHALLLGCVAAGALAAAAAGLAGAASVERLLSGTVLAASEMPGMLGPITENGRVGWECKPEKAAEATSAGRAELPRPQTAR
jgi:hypothetical protein